MMNRLGLRQLRAFHAVIMTGSVTAAAERLNLTQPAISKQLNILEEATGLNLFHRKSGRTTTPTSVGIDFFRAIEPTMVGLDDIDTIVKTLANRDQKMLRIAATPPLINSAPLMQALKRFTESYPEVTLSLEPRHRLEIEDWVASRRIDIALALLPLNHPALKAVHLVETEAVAVLSPDHALADHRQISPADLADVPVILPSRQPLRTRIDAELEKAHQALTPNFEATSAITAARLAASGFGVAICDPFSPTAFDNSLATVPWVPRVKLNYGALYSESLGLEPAAQDLLEYIEDAFPSGRL